VLQFIRDHLYKESQLFVSYREGQIRGQGCLDEYSYVIRACLDLYQITQDQKWFSWGRELQATLDRDFWDEENDGYFFSVSPELPDRKKVVFDGATPSGNSITLQNLQTLYALSGEREYHDRKEKMFR